MRIRSSALDKGLMFYEMGLNKFFGNSIIKRLEDCPCRTDEEVLSALKPTHNEGDGSWVDICGMIAPQQQIHRSISRAVCQASQVSESMRGASPDAGRALACSRVTPSRARSKRSRERSRPSARRVLTRSEERRVGKECRSRWSPYH